MASSVQADSTLEEVLDHWAQFPFHPSPCWKENAYYRSMYFLSGFPGFPLACLWFYQIKIDTGQTTNILQQKGGLTLQGCTAEQPHHGNHARKCLWSVMFDWKPFLFELVRAIKCGMTFSMGLRNWLLFNFASDDPSATNSQNGLNLAQGTWFPKPPLRNGLEVHIHGKSPSFPANMSKTGDLQPVYVSLPECKCTSWKERSSQIKPEDCIK